MSGARRSPLSPSGFQVIFEQPDRPTPPPSTGEPVFRPRRYHTKSRNGCFNCKKRRIKCNEAQPECSNCWEKSLQCEYPPANRSPQPQPASIPLPDRKTSRSRHSPPAKRLAESSIAAILHEDDVPGDVLKQQGYRRSDVFELLHHFVNATDQPWIGSPLGQRLIQELAHREASNAPYLLYSALAFSAAHMHYLDPASSKYRVAAPYHYQHSLRRYYDKLSRALDGEDAEALFASCQLHAFLAFYNATSAHDGSLGIDLGWVRSMRGIRFITESPQLLASLQRGSFRPIITLAGHDWQNIVQQEQLDTDPRVSADLRQLQVLGEVCLELQPQQRDAMLQAISMLRDLAQVLPSPAVVGTFMVWISRIPSTVIELLEIAEPAALLTIGTLCAFFSRIDEWWIVEPARAECRNVCQYIDGLQDSRYEGALAYLRSFS